MQEFTVSRAQSCGGRMKEWMWFLNRTQLILSADHWLSCNNKYLYVCLSVCLSVFLCLSVCLCVVLSKGQNPLHQFPRSKSVTNWHLQKSVVSVVSCHFTNSITTTCWQLVTDLLATSWHVEIVCRVANKFITSWQLPNIQGSYGKRACRH